MRGSGYGRGCWGCAERSSRTSSSTRTAGRGGGPPGLARARSLRALPAPVCRVLISATGRRRWRALDLGTTLAFVEADAPRVSVAATAWSCARSRGRVTARGSRARLRTRRVAGGQHVQDRGRGADADRVAHGRLDLRARHGRGAARGRPARRPQAHRDRRDQPSQGPALPDRRRLPRQRPAGVGRAGPRPHDASSAFLDLLGDERCDADRAGVLRHGRLDRPPARRPAPARGPLRRPLPRRASSPPTRSTRSAARSGTQARNAGQARPCPISRARASRCGRTPSTSPTARNRRCQRSSRPTSRSTAPTCSKNNCARSTGSRPSTRRAAGRLAAVGTPQPARAVRQARAHDHRTARGDRGRDRARALKRPHRSDQHQIRLITRRAFGFHSADALIALAMLTLADSAHRSQDEPTDPRQQQERRFGPFSNSIARSSWRACGGVSAESTQGGHSGHTPA